MVRSLIGISRPFEEFSELLPESAQNDMKKIEKAGFSQEMSHDPLDLLLFYKSMYLPMLGVRHASRSVVVGYEEAEAHFMQGFLLFVKKGIALQGAALLAKCGGRLVMKILGVSEGSFSITRSGVNSALVYFSLRHAFSSGFRVMDFGLSGPFRSDGVLAFKRKWGTTEFADRGNPVVCAAFCDEKAKREFLGRYRPYLMDEIEETDAPVIP